jgi:filamentous hemagglutinin family protein
MGRTATRNTSGKTWHQRQLRQLHQHQRRLRRTVLSVALGSVFAAPGAWANPTDPVVIHGTASFAGHGNTLTITNSPNAIIHWQSFSIGVDELTRFQQINDQSAVLNRVVGPDASSLLGTLQSNGHVLLINPAGILIGHDARIDVAGLIASTLNIADLDFLGGKLNFQAGALAGSVVNHGIVATPFGGRVFLIGPQVENNGIIRTPGGGAVLAAGRQVTLGDTSAPNIAVQVSAPGDRAVNLGEILVEGGSAGLYGALVDQKGVVRADSISRDTSGRIVLRASKDVTLAAGSTTSASGVKGGEVLVESRTGTTLVEGRVAANATATQGGTVMLLGDRVGIVGESRVEASGPIAGGSILVGGDYRGANPLVMNAGAVYVGERTTLSADALSEGRGGRIVLWSEQVTRAYGDINARGAGSGNGGFVETSSRGELDITRGPTLGSGGTWLIDPRSILIDTGTGTTHVTENRTATESLFTPNASDRLDSRLGADLIATRLSNGTSVIVDTSDPDSTGPGDITVDAPISKVSGGAATLTLKAHGDIVFTGRGDVVSTAGALDVVLQANQDSSNGGTVRMTNGSRIETNGGRLVIGGGADPLANPAAGSATFPAGVVLQGATILTGAGDIEIRGLGGNFSGDTSGVRIDATRMESTTGRISILGVADGVAGTSNVSGVAIVNGSTVRTTTGALLIDGTGPGLDKTPAAANNQGVLVGASLVATSSGRIDVTGNGGRATGVFDSGRANTIAGMAGVRIDGGGTIESKAGDIVVTGTAGVTAPRADGSWGLAIFGERGVDARPTGIFSAGGDITVTGTAPGTAVARSGSNNHGVFLFQDATIRATGNGDVTVTGDAGFGSGGFLEGVLLWGGGSPGERGSPTIQSANGQLRVTGIGGDTDGSDTPWTGQQLDSNNGVTLSQGGRLVSTGAGSITVTGTGGNAPGGPAGAAAGAVFDSYNRGIVIYAADVSDPLTGVFAESAGSITLNGTGGSSAARDSSRNDGIVVAGAQARVSAAGVTPVGQPAPAITLVGTQATGHRNRNTAGVYIDDRALVDAAGAATVRITGTAAVAARDLNDIRGVAIVNRAQVRSSTGAIEVVGVASASAASAAYGVSMYGSAAAGDAFTGIVSTSGNITLSGTGGGTAGRMATSPQGVSIVGHAGILTGGNGTITATGDAGVGDGHLAPGFLVFDATAAGAPTIAAVDGDIRITGTAAGTVSVGAGFIAEGVSIVSGGVVRTTGAGNIRVTGTGGNNAAGGNNGVAIAVGVFGAPLPGIVEARGTGSIHVEGFSGTARLNASNAFTTGGVAVIGGVVRTGVDVALGGGSITLTGHAATDGVDETTTRITPQIDAVVIRAGEATVSGAPSFVDAEVRSHGGGAITIHGDVTGARAFGRAGVNIQGGVVNGGSGAVTITGIGGATEPSASGVVVTDGTFSSVLRQGEIVTTTGAIRVEGSFAPYIGPRTSRLGATVVWGGGRIASADGDITLIGRAPGTPVAPVFGDNSGIGIGNGGVVETSGRGNIVLQGHGGHSTDGLISGVYIANDFLDAERATTPGAAPRVSATGSGGITITGIAGGHGPDGRLVHGIFVGGAFTHPTVGSLYDRFAAKNGTTIDAPHASISVNSGRLALRGYGPGYTDNFAAPVLDDSLGAAGQTDGVALVHGASVTATGTGSVDIEGRAGNALGFLDGGRLVAESFGVHLLRQARVGSASGAISVRGFADFGADATGVAMDTASAMTTVNGAIEVRGFGGGTAARPAAQFSDGIRIAGGSRIEATGTGGISLLGTGGYVSGILTPTMDPVTNQIVDTMAAFSQGLLIRSGSLVRTASGSIVLEGTAPDGATDTFHLYGLLVGGPNTIGATPTRVTSATGNITLKGVGAGDPTHRVGSLSMGVVLRDAVSVSTGGLGNVSIDGTGAFGTGSTNAGVNMLTGAPDIFARVQVEHGRIDIVGRAGDTTATAPLVPPGQPVHRYMHGVSLLDGVRVVATGIGSISINGTGGNAPLGDNVGVAFTRDVLVEAGAGSITIVGTAGSAAALAAAPHLDSYGVWISGATVRGAGAVTIIGNGPVDGLAFDPSTPVTPSIHGVRIAFNGGANQHTFVGTPGLVQGGTVAITGDTHGAGTASEAGVSIDSSEVVSTAASLTISGFAGPGNGAVGVAIDATDTPRSRLHVGPGTLTLNGVGPDGGASTVPGQAAGVSIRRSDVTADAVGSVILHALGGATQDATTSITAGGLLVRGDGTFDLTLGNNAVQRIASNVVGTLRFVNTGNLDAGETAAGTSGLTVSDGVVDVDTRGNLVVSRLVLVGADATLRARRGAGGGDVSVTTVTRSGAAPGAVSILADRHITLDGGVIRAAPGAGPLGITLAADRDGDADGAIALRKGEAISALVSNGGDIVLGGGLDPRTTPAVASGALVQGVGIHDSIFDAGAGNIVITGRSRGSTTDISADGVGITGGSKISTTSGNITIVGDVLPLAGARGNQGVVVYTDGATAGEARTAITTGTGTIDIRGTAPGTVDTPASGDQSGTYIVNAIVRATGNGNIRIEGDGGVYAGTGVSAVFIANGALVESLGSGTIDITGRGGRSLLPSGGVFGSGVAISLDSPGPTNGANAPGVVKGAAGTITITGFAPSTGSASSNTSGVAIGGGNVSIGTGSIVIQGHGSGTVANPTGSDTQGVWIAKGAVVEATGKGGSIGVTGDGGAAIGIENDTYSLNLPGQQIFGIFQVAASKGIALESGAVMKSADGDITLFGTPGAPGASTVFNAGISIRDSGTLVSAAGAGRVSITGDASAATVGGYSQGVIVTAGAIVETTGSAGLSITGLAADATFQDSTRIVLTRGTGSNPDTLIDHVATYSHGVLIIRDDFESKFNPTVAGPVVRTGSGALNITGRAAHATTTSHDMVGVAIYGGQTDANGALIAGSNARVSSGGGAITIDGTAAGSLDRPVGRTTRGVSVEQFASVTTTGSGTIDIAGHGGFAAGMNDPAKGYVRSDSVGIFIGTGSEIRSGAGLISFRGNAPGTGVAGRDTYGVWVRGAGTSIATDSGRIALVGTGAGTADAMAGPGSYGVLVSDGATMSGVAGSIGIDGTGGVVTTGDESFGVSLQSASVRSISGNIGITGRGTIGVDIVNGLLQAGGTGAVASLDAQSGRLRLAGGVSSRGRIELRSAAGVSMENDGTTTLGQIDADELLLLGTGNFALEASPLRVARLAGDVAGNIRVTIDTDTTNASLARNGGVFSIATVGGTDGLQATHGGVIEVTTVGSATFEVQAPVRTTGIHGAAGATPGENGQDGTAAGAIALRAIQGASPSLVPVILVRSTVESLGGNGGRGADGAAGANGVSGAVDGSPGGAGGAGGRGGDAGSVTLASAGDVTITGTVRTLHGAGGDGGNGGAGGAGLTATRSAPAGNGGDGGAGGDSGAHGFGGRIEVTGRDLRLEAGSLVTAESQYSPSFSFPNRGSGGAGGAGGAGLPEVTGASPLPAVPAGRAGTDGTSGFIQSDFRSEVVLRATADIAGVGGRIFEDAAASLVSENLEATSDNGMFLDGENILSYTGVFTDTGNTLTNNLSGDLRFRASPFGFVEFLSVVNSAPGGKVAVDLSGGIGSLRRVGAMVAEGGITISNGQLWVQSSYEFRSPTTISADIWWWLGEIRALAGLTTSGITTLKGGDGNPLVMTGPWMNTGTIVIPPSTPQYPTDLFSSELQLLPNASLQGGLRNLGTLRKDVDSVDTFTITGRVENTSDLTRTGSIVVESGTLALDTLALDAGTVTGAGVLAVSRLIDWSAGTIGGGARVRVRDTADLFVNDGGTTLDGTLVLEGDRTLDDSPAAGTPEAYGLGLLTGSGVVDNVGTLTTGASGGTSIGISLLNHGTITVDADAALDLSATLSTAGRFTNAGTVVLRTARDVGAATLEATGGVFNLGGAVIRSALTSTGETGADNRIVGLAANGGVITADQQSLEIVTAADAANNGTISAVGGARVLIDATAGLAGTGSLLGESSTSFRVIAGDGPSVTQGAFAGDRLVVEGGAVNFGSVNAGAVDIDSSVVNVDGNFTATGATVVRTSALRSTAASLAVGGDLSSASVQILGDIMNARAAAVSVQGAYSAGNTTLDLGSLTLNGGVTAGALSATGASQVTIGAGAPGATARFASFSITDEVRPTRTSRLTVGRRVDVTGNLVIRDTNVDGGGSLGTSGSATLSDAIISGVGVGAALGIDAVNVGGASLSSNSGIVTVTNSTFADVTAGSLEARDSSFVGAVAAGSLSARNVLFLGGASIAGPGTLAGNITIGAAAELSMAGGNLAGLTAMTGGTFRNATGGDLLIDRGLSIDSAVVNDGVLRIAADLQTGAFDNTGTLELREVTTGVATFAAPTLRNSGTILSTVAAGVTPGSLENLLVSRYTGVAGGRVSVGAGTARLAASAGSTFDGTIEAAGGQITLALAGNAAGPAGTLRTAGAGDTIILESGGFQLDQGSVVNGGTLRVQGGALTTGTLSGSGTTDLQQGALLTVNGVAAGGTLLVGNGTARLAGIGAPASFGTIAVGTGTLATAGDLGVTTLTLGGGRLDRLGSGAPVITVASSFGWNGGTVGSGLDVTIPRTATLSLAGTTTLDGSLTLLGNFVASTFGTLNGTGSLVNKGTFTVNGGALTLQPGLTNERVGADTTTGIVVVAADGDADAVLDVGGVVVNRGEIRLVSTDFAGATLRSHGGIVNTQDGIVLSRAAAGAAAPVGARLDGQLQNAGEIRADTAGLVVAVAAGTLPGGAINDGVIRATGPTLTLDLATDLAGTGRLGSEDAGGPGTAGAFDLQARGHVVVQSALVSRGRTTIGAGDYRFGDVSIAAPLGGTSTITDARLVSDGALALPGVTVLRSTLQAAGDVAGDNGPLVLRSSTLTAGGGFVGGLDLDRESRADFGGAFTPVGVTIAGGELVLRAGVVMRSLQADDGARVRILAPAGAARIDAVSINATGVGSPAPVTLTTARALTVGDWLALDAVVDGAGSLGIEGQALLGGNYAVPVTAGAASAGNVTFGAGAVLGRTAFGGTVDIGTGRTVRVAGADLAALTAMRGGTLENTGDIEIADRSLDVGAAFVNLGTVRIAGAVAPGGLPRSTLSLGGGLVNRGEIRLVSSDFAGATLRSDGGIINDAGATIASLSATGSTAPVDNRLEGQLQNAGAIQASGAPLTLAIGSGPLPGGAFSNGTITASGGRGIVFQVATDFLGTGTISVTDSSPLTFDAIGARVAQSALRSSGATTLRGGTFVFDTLAAAGRTTLSGGARLDVTGAADGGVLQLGDGRARLSNTGPSATFSTIEIGAGTLETGRVVDVSTLTLGGGAIRTFTDGGGVTHGGSLAVGNRFDWNGGTIAGGIDVTIARAATLTLAGANTLDGALTLLGSTSVTALGSLGGTGSIVNRGTMVVGNDLTLAPRLVNERIGGDASTGNVEVRAGAGAGASLAAAGGVVNEGGTITLVANGARAASLSGGSAGVVNRGTLISRGEGSGPATGINVVTDLRTSGVVSAESAALRLGALQGSGSGSITAGAAAVTFDLAADYAFLGTVDIGAGGRLGATANGHELSIATLNSAADLVAANGRSVLGTVTVTGGRGVTVATGGNVRVTGRYDVAGTTLLRDDGALRLEGAGTLSGLVMRDTGRLTFAGDASATVATLDGGVVAIETGRRLAVSDLAMDAAATVEGGGRLDVLAATTAADNFRIAPGATIRGTVANFGRGYIGSLSGDATGMLINAGSLTLRDTGPVTIAPRFRNDVDGPLAGTLFVDRPVVFLGSVENRGDVLVAGTALNASAGLDNSGTLRLSAGAPAGVASIAVGGGALTNRAGGSIVSGTGPTAATAASATNRIEGVLLSAGTIRTQSEHLTLQTGTAAPGSNTGAFEVVGGDMTLVLGEDFVNTGSIATGPGFRFSVQAGTHTFDSIGGSLATADALTFDRGTVKLGALAITSNEPLSIRAGTLVTVDGAFAVPGITTVSEGSTLHLSGGGTAGAMVVDGAALVVDSQPLTMDTLSLRGGSVDVGAGGGIVTDLLAQTGGTIRVAGSLTPALATLEGGVLEVLAGGRMVTPALALSPGVVLNGAGDLLVTENLAGDESGIGTGFRNLTLTKSGDFDVARPYAATGTLGLRSTAGRLHVNGVSVVGNSISLDGANVQVGGARPGDSRVTAASDLDVRTAGALVVDGSAGAAKLLAGGRIGITAASVSVDAGSHGASIDPDQITMDLTGALTLTGGTAPGAAADVTGRTVDISASSIALAGGTAPGTEAVIAATGGDMRLAVAGVSLTGGAGTDADALLYAPAGAITLTGLDCTGCTVVTTNPRGDGLTSAGAFALAFSRNGSFDPPAARGDDEGFDSAISGVNQALDAARRLQNLEVLTEEERNDGKGKRLALRLPSCR